MSSDDLPKYDQLVTASACHTCKASLAAGTIVRMKPFETRTKHNLSFVQCGPCAADELFQPSSNPNRPGDLEPKGGWAKARHAAVVPDADGIGLSLDGFAGFSPGPILQTMGASSRPTAYEHAKRLLDEKKLAMWPAEEDAPSVGSWWKHSGKGRTPPFDAAGTTQLSGWWKHSGLGKAPPLDAAGAPKLDGWLVEIATPSCVTLMDNRGNAHHELRSSWPGEWTQDECRNERDASVRVGAEEMPR